MVTDTDQQADRSLDELVAIARQVSSAVQTVISGKPAAIRLALTVLLAEGHVLIEDVPGVGKTHITGVSAYNQELREFEFKPGPVFANIVLGDEINRASPKTQSALLESMEESQVTVDGSTYQLERPFMVIATQNPVEMEGTYPLPEAQRDRFMARISIGYPDRDSELAMLETHGSSSPLDELKPVAHASDIRALVAAVREVHVSASIRQYIVELVNGTRASAELRLGASPRAALHLLRACRAYAALDDRDFVLPDDVQALVCRSSPTGCCRARRRWSGANYLIRCCLPLFADCRCRAGRSTLSRRGRKDSEPCGPRCSPG